jgi:type I site-specific restriction endonuclease
MNKEAKDINKNVQKEQKATAKKASYVTAFADKDNTEDVNFAYYSRALNKPFDSLNELRAAEAEYYAEIKAKEDKAATKKADAQKVEEAFKALNTTRKAYKETLVKLTEKYSQDLKSLKETFEADKKELTDILAQAEEAYSVALKAFTDKYPEGYHLTLKDGDFETTISGASKVCKESYTNKPFDFIDWFFSL